MLQLHPGKLFINGGWEDAQRRDTIDIVNLTGNRRPSSRAVTSTEPWPPRNTSLERKSWRGMDPSRKKKILWDISEILLKHREELAVLESMENGKTVREAGGADVDPAIDAFRYYAVWVRKIYGETIPVDGPFLNYTLREPVDVAGGIVPWNCPLLDRRVEGGAPSSALASSNNELGDVGVRVLVICWCRAAKEPACFEL
ncbi:MAG TPA: aldehyde dehydrogenase family protein [Bryobacteraceae bacterium]|nr:aldehyde dehydrogenase family protein [Bryobacteraceae bacterium]